MQSEAFSVIIVASSFPAGISLRRHLKSHDAHNICEICEKTFQSKQLLERHSSKHTKVKKYTCENCQDKFTLNSNLQRHKTIVNKINSAHNC